MIVTRKSTARECYNLKYIQGMPKLNVLPGSATNQKNCKGVSQSKDCQGKITIKRISYSVNIGLPTKMAKQNSYRQ